MSRINRSVLSLEVPTVSSFSTGGVARSKTDAFIHDSGMYYWDGDLPYTVPPESEPTTIGPGSWVLVSDFGLRKELASGDGSLIGVGGEATLKDVVQSKKSVLLYGVKGDGSDESVAFQRAINSGYALIPHGCTVHITDVFVPHGTTIKMEGSGSIVLDSKDALKFQKDEPYKVNPVQGTSKVIEVSGFIRPNDNWLKIHRPFVQTDEWYIQNSENPEVLGYTAEVFKIASIQGSKVTLTEPVGFDLDTSSYVTKIASQVTTIQGGNIISNVPISAATWCLFVTDTSNINFEDVKFDFQLNGGVRFNACHGVNFTNCYFYRSGAGGTVMYAYGSTDCTLSHCTHYGSKVYDVIINVFGGNRRIISEYSKYYIEQGSSTLGGFYIGAKSIGCKSVHDTFIGGNYGVMAMFGAQQFEFISPYCRGQIVGSVYTERCQYFSVINPNIKLDQSGLSDSDTSWGGIVVKDCDYFNLLSTSRGINCNRRMLSMYNFPSTRTTFREGVRVSLKGTGDMWISTRLSKAVFSDCETQGSLIVYASGGFSCRSVIVRNSVLGSIQFNACFHSRVQDSTFTGTGTGIKITGDSRWNYFLRNVFENARLCYELTQEGRFRNSIYDVRCYTFPPKVVNYTVNSTDAPAVGYLQSEPARTGFTLYVTEHLNNGEVIRTKEGFRHTGYNRGTKQDWIGIGVSEGTL